MGFFNHVLVPLDGSQLAECVLPHLIALTGPDTQITLAQALIMGDGSSVEQPVDQLLWRITEAEADAYLEGVSERIRATGRKQVESVVLEGGPATPIIEYAHQNNVDLILLSSHGRSGISRWNISAVVRKIIQGSHLSTMVVRAYMFGELRGLTAARYRKILLPLDGSLRAELSLSAAAAIAQYHDATLVLAHIITRPEIIQRVPPTPDDQLLMERLNDRVRITAESYFEHLRSRYPVPIETEIRGSNNITNALQHIIETRDIDLVVFSAHGHSADPQRMHGSVAASLIEYSSIPVIALQDLSPDEVKASRAEEAAREHRGHA